MSKPFDLQTMPLNNGMTLVEAGAGTGKTHCLTRLVLRLILEGVEGESGPLKIGQILVVTFTNAAADELVTRIRRLLGAAERAFAGKQTDDDFFLHLLDRHGDAGLERIREAQSQCDDLAVSTIHGFCQRVLTNQAFESAMPFEAGILDDENVLLRQTAADFWRRHVLENELLSALAVRQTWDMETMIEAFRTWHRFPEPELLPHVPSLETAETKLKTVLGDFMESWDRSELELLLAPAPWKKNKPFSKTKREETFNRIDALCNGSWFEGLPVIEACQTAMVRGALDGRKKFDPPDHPLFTISDELASSLEILYASFFTTFIRDLAGSLDLEKRRRHVMGYNDLLRRLDSALNPGNDLNRAERLRASISKTYQAALIDEFQDTDPFQYRIFRNAFSGRPLFLVGDPKQAIYGFRGADIHTYLEARKKVGAPFSLNTNWRSEAGLVRAVNRVFGHTPLPFTHRDIPFTDAEPAGRIDETPLSGDSGRPLHWWFVPPADGKTVGKGKSWERIKRAVTTEILRLISRDGPRIGGRPVRPADIAVLVKNNRRAREIQRVLTTAGVLSITGTTDNIFDSREMTELSAILAAVADPGNPRTMVPALATEFWGMNASDISRLRNDDTGWLAVTETLQTVCETWTKQGFMPAVEHLVSRLEVRPRLAAFIDGERRLTNLAHAVELLNDAATGRQMGPESLLQWIRRTRQQGHDTADRAELRLESEADAVRIATVHKAKGLQYGIVFCLDLWDSRPFGKREPILVHTDGTITLALCGEDRDRLVSRAEAERLAEDLRVTYVAMTRAIHRCYVVWGAIANPRGKKGGAHSSALGYLLRPTDHKPPSADDLRHRDQAREYLEKEITDWHGTLDDLVEKGSDLMTIEMLSGDSTLPGVPRADRELGATGADLEPRRAAAGIREQLVPWRVTSFSALTRDAGHEKPDHFDPSATVPGDDEEPIGIFAFARGARPGSCLHEIFEHCDFTRTKTPETAALISETLRRYGLSDPSRHRGSLDPDSTVQEMLHRVTSTPVPEGGFSLDRIPREKRLNEWMFHLPLTSLSPRDLAIDFTRHAGNKEVGDYAAVVEGLSGEVVSGFLTGFIDLVVEHEGRYHLFDWKSNHLGNSRAEYGPDALWSAMEEHHYVLQYHFYCLALHRFLSGRLPGYEYDKHFGGAHYVFLRGVDGTGAGGWYSDRPSHDLIRALEERMLEGASG